MLRQFMELESVAGLSRSTQIRIAEVKTLQIVLFFAKNFKVLKLTTEQSL